MFNVLSLFSNIGVGEYLIPESYRVVLASELESFRCKVYGSIYPGHEIIEGDIIERKSEIINKSRELGVNVVIATPPCQSFSVINNKKQEGDLRDNLVVHAIDIVRELQPRLALFENVAKQAGLVIDGLLYEDYLRKHLSGYTIHTVVLNAADFGVPQRRKRLFTIISKTPLPLPAKQKHITLREAIGSLASIEVGDKTADTMHYGPPNSAHHVLWAKHTPTGKSSFENYGINEYYPQVEGGRRIKGYNTTYRRMYWDDVSYTITMNHAGPNGSNTLHPGRPLEDGMHSDARTMSLRETARIMGLPDRYVLPDYVSYRNGMKLLGEGLCPVVVRDLLLLWKDLI